MYLWIMIYARYHNPIYYQEWSPRLGFWPEAEAILGSYLSLMYFQKVEVSFDNSYYKTFVTSI